jgi:hypothetical protein
MDPLMAEAYRELEDDIRANEQKIGQRRVAVLQPSTSARVF